MNLTTDINDVKTLLQKLNNININTEFNLEYNTDENSEIIVGEETEEIEVLELDFETALTMISTTVDFVTL